MLSFIMRCSSRNAKGPAAVVGGACEKAGAVHISAYLTSGLMVLAAACGGSIPKTHYYVLNLPPPAPRAGDPSPYTAVVMPVRAPEQLEQDRIVYSPSPVEIEFYEYHRWAQRPAETLTNAIAERLRAARLFSNVIVFDGRTKGDYLIRSRLNRLEEVDSENGVAVTVELAADAVEAKNNRVVWTSSASHTGPVTSGDVRAVVTEMSRGVDACLGKITADLENLRKAFPPPPAPASIASP
ncbi:MAG TPA: PqiC family protein [Bryobacterales bacterium]|nr:PqiC family protein [Bryobacterales bacterium]